MMWPLIIQLAGAPKGKGRPRFVRKTGVAYTPEQTRSYEAMLRLAGMNAMIRNPDTGDSRFHKPLEGPLDVRVLARFPIPASWSKKRREAALRGEIRPTSTPDADNILKMLDAWNQVVWQDDKQIVDAAIRKEYSERPTLIVTIEGAV